MLFEFMGVGDPNHPPAKMDAEAKQRQLYELMHRIVRAQDAQGLVTVTLIDDLHWVDAGSNGFVNQLVSAVAGRRSLMVLNFRPEYVAAFAAKAHYQQLPLVPLGDAPLRELIAGLIGHDESVTELSNRIIEWTSGNPFCTEELINALIESGDLHGHPGHYRLMTTLERLVMPTNVRAVLTARIDRLPEAAKRLLQTAAVIGKEFSGPLLEAVADLPLSEQAGALERLKAGDFIYERALYPVFGYAFKHPLTQEVAYQSQLQSRRAVVHAAVARALEVQADDKLDEQAALLAHHCELAGEILNAARWHKRAAEWAGMSLAKDRGAAMEIMASCTVCNALSIQRDWQSMLQVATDTLRRIRETGTLGLWEPLFFAHIANAHLELGQVPLARAAAQAGVDFMRESKSVFSPRSYALFARAQLELLEPATDIASTLDEYATLLERTRFRLYAGELDELRARLAEREGQKTERSAALTRALDGYTRFGMTAQAARIAGLQAPGLDA